MTTTMMKQTIARIVRGDHDAAGDIVLLREKDGRFAFVTRVSTDTVVAEIKCGAPMSARELAAIGIALMRIATKKRRKKKP
jgi:hypothetical protein